jgi:hypothetical protein
LLFTDDYLLPFPIDIRNCKRPERDQIDSRHEFGSKRWQEFPVPSDQSHQDGCDHKIKHVIGRGQRTFSEQWKHKNLKGVRYHSEDHGCLEAPSTGGGDGSVRHDRSLSLVVWMRLLARERK